jgi:chemotaxis protein methyltransferase CheR
MELTKTDFNNIRSYIYKLCGLAIPDEKKYLIQQRLEPFAASTGCKNFSQFYQKLVLDESPAFKHEIIAAMTTNETSFFRDQHPFIAFEKFILPQLCRVIGERKESAPDAAGQNGVHIWCAAASSGQEPYSLAMLIHEFVKANRYHRLAVEDFTILASDISPTMQKKAMAAEYNELEISRGLCRTRKEKYFTKDGAYWKLHDDIRKMVRFKLVNLINANGNLGRFDVIFCRNVLIYFDQQTKDKIITQFNKMLMPGGLLVIGATESFGCQAFKFEKLSQEQTILYKKICA